MRRVTLRNANPAKTRCDAVVVGLMSTAKGAVVAEGGEDVAKAYGRKLRPLLVTLGATGKPGEVVRVPGGDVTNAGLVVFVGLGAPGPDGEVPPQAVRRAAGQAARAVTNAASVALALPAGSPEQLRAVVEGYALGGYTFTTYKKSTKDDDAQAHPGEVVVLCPGARRAEMQTVVEEAQVVAEAVAGARDWVNMPPGDFTPPEFADAVVEAAKATSKGRGARKLSARVIDEKELLALGCGGIVGVGQGSSAPPRMVELTYSPAKPVAHLALVGKGVTFDSGGLTIKPAASMNEMKSDMAGAAAVVQATCAIARLKLPLKVSTFVPMAENMISGSAVRPGDVLTMYGGTTVEVLNTDAEGRLILGDALVRATEVEPDVILDVATLTGHMVVALGDKVAGVMGSDDIVDGGAGRVRDGRRGALAHAHPRGDGRAHPRAARSPTCPSTTGSAGAAACSRRPSCASSPAAGRGRTSTSRARPGTRADRRATTPSAAPAGRSRPWSTTPERCPAEAR